MAKALPPRITPDQLTLLGLAGAAVTGTAYVLCHWNILFLWLANLGLVLNWIGDSLDGTVARVRGKERKRYGFFVDHTTDLFAQLLIGLGLGVSPFVQFDVACLVLIVYLALAAVTFIKKVSAGELQISFGGIGPTEVRLALLLINLALLWYRPAAVLTLWEPLSVIDLAILAVAALGVGLLLVTVLHERQRIARDDP
jgi:phosphatidylglycerophosphate synthase